LSDIEA